MQQIGNTLRIVNAQPANGGVYICLAENSEGMDRSYTVLDIDSKLNVPMINAQFSM